MDGGKKDREFMDMDNHMVIAGGGKEVEEEINGDGKNKIDKKEAKC